MNSNLSLKEEIDIFINIGLNPTELFIVRMLFLAQDGEPEMLFNYVNNTTDGKDDLKKSLATLQDKGIILKGYNIPKEGEAFNYKIVPLNKNFLKKYIRESNQMGKELFELYPSHMLINGRRASIKNITKAGLFSLDEFCTFYAKQLKLSSITHERVMEALQFAVDNELIRYSLLEFIASQKWNEIEYIRDSGEVSGYNNVELL